MTKTLLSLFDYSGQWSAPFADAGWMVVQVDIKHGHDIKKFSAKWLINNLLQGYPTIDGILALAFCAANAGSQLGRKIKAIEAAANEIVEAPPAGLASSYISGFLNRNLPDIHLRAWERTG